MVLRLLDEPRERAEPVLGTVDWRSHRHMRISVREVAQSILPIKIPLHQDSLATLARDPRRLHASPRRPVGHHHPEGKQQYATPGRAAGHAPSRRAHLHLNATGFPCNSIDSSYSALLTARLLNFSTPPGSLDLPRSSPRPRVGLADSLRPSPRRQWLPCRDCAGVTFPSLPPSEVLPALPSAAFEHSPPPPSSTARSLKSVLTPSTVRSGGKPLSDSQPAF
ncbi:hypothetical protein CALVIDRAFT_566985 [Calocera viscosa TUFC12733]|uniref:Uncharacterized protein n=1 Tax=Calocera viscosa (strain TUFC12733) TaxID=1330018 RepID=A0A167IRB2_CALVF|nr:hypothetical protein CALVIDRAFT_566985 [Calocera viscosa TUFC12733]